MNSSWNIEINASCCRSFLAIWLFKWGVQEVGTFFFYRVNCQSVISIRNAALEDAKIIQIVWYRSPLQLLLLSADGVNVEIHFLFKWERECVCAYVFDVFDEEIGAIINEWYRSLVSSSVYPVTKRCSQEKKVSEFSFWFFVNSRRRIIELFVCMQSIDVAPAENPQQF